MVKRMASHHSSGPYVLCVKNLSELCSLIYGANKYTFRIGKHQENNPKEPLFETRCEYVVASVSEVINWAQSVECRNSTLSSYDPRGHFAYLDYRHVKELPNPNKEFLEVLDWSFCGLSGRGPDESTVWLSTRGAHTPLHSDTYGYNVVFQVYGRKKWILFPWESCKLLRPTRIPYEESSVYSDVNLFGRDVASEPSFFKDSQPRSVILEPGDLLMVPPKWWHYVESLDTSLSINTWVELGSDDLERFKESIVRTAVSLVVPELEMDETNEVLNPNEMEILSQPPSSAFSCLVNSMSCLERPGKKKDGFPSLILSKGKPVPLIFEDKLPEVTDGLTESVPVPGKRRKISESDKERSCEALSLDTQLPLVVTKDLWGSLSSEAVCKLESTGCVKDDRVIDGKTDKIELSVQCQQTSDNQIELGVQCQETSDNSRSTPLLFLKALTDPEVVDLISKKMLEFSKAV